PAFRMNFLNAISTDLQHFETKLWNTRQEDTESRFAEFLRNRCIRPVGRKKLHIKMEDLATELGVTRLKVSKMLANMEEKQWLTYTRGNITVKALELLGY
ncbi:MAG: helix-turn-helix domain-containing protein, partial [Bacteroidales bacterium]|nr:helix-turn-helix domain-containing protein [Bacteroidales bacterium]